MNMNGLWCIFISVCKLLCYMLFVLEPLYMCLCVCENWKSADVGKISAPDMEPSKRGFLAKKSHTLFPISFSPGFLCPTAASPSYLSICRCESDRSTSHHCHCLSFFLVPSSLFLPIYASLLFFFSLSRASPTSPMHRPNLERNVRAYLCFSLERGWGSEIHRCPNISLD